VRPPSGQPQLDKKGRPVDPKKEERRKVLRFLFNPELGSGFHSMRESHTMFLRLVCNIFLQTGIIDAAYPGISDPRRLTFMSLMTYAASNLEFTREGMPRVLMFGAFIASLGAMGLAILVFVIHLLGPAKH
jgi:hypothetical protein